MKKIGLLAGIGRLPVEFTRAARGMGFPVVAIGLLPEVDSELAGVADCYYTISVGQLAEILSVLKAEQVTDVTMIGKVTKEVMFNGAVQPDARMLSLLADLPDHSDDTIMLALVREIMSEGMSVLDQTALIRSLMPEPGVLTSRQPTPAEEADMEFGFAAAKEIGRLDFGQTVVVKNRAVMAVEAIEGTDACIRRGGQLGRGGVVVAKTAKPQQDTRFDVPSVGPATLQAMIEAGATALVMEAGRTLLIDRQTVLRMADAHNITIVSK